MKSSSLRDYSTLLSSALNSIDEKKIIELEDEITKRIDGNGEVYLIGNGGSAANAHHVVGDYLKSFSLCKKHLKLHCLSDNTCYITAVSNDLDYSKIYEILVENRLESNDLIIVLSGSGNSINLVKAIRAAKEKKIKTSGIIAYSGGALLDLLDIPIHVHVNDMEIAEDCQLSIFHYLKQQILSKISFDSDISPKYSKRVSDNLIA